MPEDENGIEYTIHNGKIYYSRGNAARYLGMTDSGYTRKREALDKEDGIVVPMVILPVSRQKRFMDKRVLDMFNVSIRVGEEEKWKDELRRFIEEVDKEE